MRENRFTEGFEKAACPLIKEALFQGLLAKGAGRLAAFAAGKAGRKAALARLGSRSLGRMAQVAKGTTAPTRGMFFRKLKSPGYSGVFGKMRQGLDLATAAVPGPRFVGKGINYGARTALGATGLGATHMLLTGPALARANRVRGQAQQSAQLARLSGRGLYR